MTIVVLYGTEGCHLCEEAKSLVVSAAKDCTVHIEWVDIATDTALLSQYRSLIPVIKRLDNSKELIWPFNVIDVISFINI